ncbi:MAG TPA: glycosyltransferase [Candidatus Obscuribacterales bacterium]
MPKISICSSTYNHERYAAEAIQSVLNQTLQDFELIITDDASTDANVEVIQRFKDPRITLLCNKVNRGNMAALDNSVARSSGQYIAWLTTDDVWEPSMLEVLSTYLDEHPDALGVFGRALFIDEAGNPVDYCFDPGEAGVGLSRFEHLNNLFRVDNHFCYPAGMIRRSTFEKLGYFPLHLRQIHDLAYWILALFHGELPILPDKLLRFRLRDNNANAGSETPENRRRVNFEVFENLALYADHIRDADLLLKIFPEVRQHPWPIEDRLVTFHLAHVALAHGTAVHRLFGLDLLYKLMADRNTAEYLRARCNFDYPDLFRLEAEKPVFADYDELDRDTASLHQEIACLKKMLEDGIAHRKQLEDAYQQLLSSTSWKIASFFQRARSALTR